MLVLPAPAKLNLYLHITAKRSDGYHLLDTIFQLIDLCDTVRLSPRSDGQIVLHTPIDGLHDAQHLAVKAAICLKQHTANPLGADLWVDKHIPSGAGLGGGSSDAATTLIGLNHLWGCGLSSAQLQALGLLLGADVPFFCSALGTAHASGIGEQLTDIASNRQENRKGYIVVYPDCHLPTPSVFKHPALKWSAQRAVHDFSASGFVDTVLTEPFQNDLQAPACLIAPPIQAALDWLRSAQHDTLIGARMSGSGSAVFAQFASLAHAKAALQTLQEQPAPHSQHWQIWALQALSTHPAHAQLNS